MVSCRIPHSVGGMPCGADAKTSMPTLAVIFGAALRRQNKTLSLQQEIAELNLLVVNRAFITNHHKLTQVAGVRVWQRMSEATTAAAMSACGCRFAIAQKKRMRQMPRL